MRTRGTRGGILLSLEASDGPQAIEEILGSQRDLLTGKVVVEVAERVPWSSVSSLARMVEEAGGELAEVRPPTAVVQSRGETRIIARTIRSGAMIESSGSIVVLGDVNSGAELVASDDIIVIGTLRGLAHAGAAGNEKAVIWAQQILSPQLRIGSALAQSGGTSGEARGPEIALLEEGAIVLRPWS